MTATDVELPDYEGERVSRASIKITGAGTGMNEGLKVRPIVMDLDDEAYFVIRVKCAESATHYRDNNGLLVRLHRVHTEDMAPIDDETAEKALGAFAEAVEKAKAERDGQMSIDDLEAAEVVADLHERQDAAAEQATGESDVEDPPGDMWTDEPAPDDAPTPIFKKGQQGK